jgi:hypothetical protein
MLPIHPGSKVDRDGSPEPLIEPPNPFSICIFVGAVPHRNTTPGPDGKTTGQATVTRLLYDRKKIATIRIKFGASLRIGGKNSHQAHAGE